MKLMDAQRMIEAVEKAKTGYLVHFEHRGDGVLRSDYFPAIQEGEKPFSNSEVAWDYAERFAKAMTSARCVNVYVTQADFTPVDDYRRRLQNPWPKP